MCGLYCMAVLQTRSISSEIMAICMEEGFDDLDAPVMLAAVNERLASPFSATFEYGLDLLITGLRTRYVPADEPAGVSAGAGPGIQGG